MSHALRDIWIWICGAAATIGTWLAYLLGGWDAAIGTMFVAMALDYVTGILCALIGRSPKTQTGHFSSAVAFRGITIKMMMLIIIMVATMVDRLLGTEGIARLAAISFYVANEGMSVIENANAMGVPFPRGLLDTLKRVKRRGDATTAIDEESTDEEDKP